jgi:hypothetical protein
MEADSYNMNDLDMLRLSHNVLAHYSEYQKKFYAHNRIFTEAFAARWDTELEKSATLLSNKYEADRLNPEKLKEVETLIEARDAITEIRYYVQRIFGRKLSEFGSFDFEAFDKFDFSKAEMLIFLQRLHFLCNDVHRKKLLEQGFSQQKTDNILTIIQSLEALLLKDKETTTITPQQDAAWKLKTQLGNTFSYWAKVNHAAKEMFMNQPELLNLFLFPFGTENPDIIKISGAVCNEYHKPLKSVLVNIAGTDICATTNSKGFYLLAGIGEGTYKLKYYKTDYRQVTREVIAPATGSVMANAALELI